MKRPRLRDDLLLAAEAMLLLALVSGLFLALVVVGRLLGDLIPLILN